MKYLRISFLICFCSWLKAQQIANYVNNGSFEEALPSATLNPYEGAKYWSGLDPTNCGSHRLRSKLLNSVPIGFGGYQYPRTGNSFICTNFYCENSSCPNEIRWYPLNRLKSQLNANHVYCVKFFVNITNNSPLAINRFGAFFGGSTLDSITLCDRPITYLAPQVEYQSGLITDTLNWTPVSGTFTAIGDEQYVVIGNFYSNANTQTLLINPTFLPALGSDIFIDDASVIDIDLPAYAGPDKRCIPGDSVFIGRNPDVGIDEACTWYQLPNMATPIATIAGLYVKPIQTTTYVVRQQLWCSGVRYDTVVVYKDAVGLEKIKIINEELKISPNPAADRINLSLDKAVLSNYFQHVEILDMQLRLIKEMEINESDASSTIVTSDLANGLYVLRLMDTEQLMVVSRKLAVQR